MSFPRYSGYKDSGVEWLGEVPEHWEIKSIRYILDAIGDVDHFMPESVEKGVPYLMTGDLKEFVSDVSLDDCKQVSHNDYLELSKRIKSSKGDVIMARYATIGTSMYVDIDVDFLVSYSCVTLKANHSKVIGFYLFQCMKSDAFRQSVENQINTNTQGNVGIKDLQNVKIAVAPIDEQTAIAAFLDRETAKIDALVAEQRRLMALLKEKRQAVISHAVTRGLNPNAPLKPSGIEWLGDVPEHWRVGAIKYFVLPKKGAIKTGPFGSHLISSDMQSGTIKVYNQRSVIDDDFESGDTFISDEKFEELASFETFPGDLLITTRGTIGRAAVLPENADRGILHPCLLRLQPDNSVVNTQFLKTLIQDSDLMKTQLSYLSNATTIEVIYSYTIASVIVPVPPLDEQESILQFLTDESAKFDTLTTEAQRAIDLLQERRTALISAAVTGQIDVRGAA